MARKMKDSGVAWIGEIPEGWKISKVSYFYDIQLGKMLQPQQKSPTDTEEKYLCAANVGKNRLSFASVKTMWFSPSEKNLFGLKQGDLLVVEGGDVASCAILNVSNQNLYFQNALHRVRPIHEESNDFLRYWLIAAKSCGYIDLICNKATIAHFSKDKFSSLQFPVVSKKEQVAIVTYLDSHCSRIDALLTKTRTSIEEYKKLKQAVITQAVTKGVRGKREMKDSGVEWIGEIPREWEIAPMKHFIDILPGYAFSSNDFSSEDGIPLLRGINVGVNEIRWDETVRWNHPISKQIDSFSLKVNDLVVGLDRPWISDGTRVAFISEKEYISTALYLISIPNTGLFL